MAITDVRAITRLTDADVDNLAVNFRAIRREIEDAHGEGDTRYIRRAIRPTAYR